MTRPRAADGCSLKPLIWTGDLNACHREVDVSHPAFFANQKRRAKAAKRPPRSRRPRRSRPAGVPANERRRFDNLVKDAGLVDAYRFLHGDAEMRMTWFGHRAWQVGKYRGKACASISSSSTTATARERVERCAQATDGISLAELAERPDRVLRE